MALLALLLVSCGSAPPAPVVERSPARSDNQIRAMSEADGTYTVREGDTLWMIAFSFGLDHRQLARWNGIPSPFVIHPGQAINLRQPATSPAVVSAVPAKPRTATRPAAQNPASKPPRSQTTPARPAPETPPARPPQVAATAPLASASTAATPTANRADLSWQWPAQGRLLRGFVASDPSRNGYDISGTEGQDVRAAAAGQVVYSGSGLIGYGELIIIKHNDRLLSAYAHNRRRLVNEGDMVQLGEKIAEMGRNDRNEQVLHFEIRKDGRPVNPVSYLPDR